MRKPLQRRRVNEIEVTTFDPVYTRAEPHWFDQRLEWIVYSSHESSIRAAVSRLLDEIARTWPESKRYIWATPFY